MAGTPRKDRSRASNASRKKRLRTRSDRAHAFDDTGFPWSDPVFQAQVIAELRAAGVRVNLAVKAVGVDHVEEPAEAAAPNVLTPPPGYVRDERNPDVFHPSWPTARTIFRALGEEMCRRIRVRGLPRPAEYSAWYSERNVEEVRRGQPVEIRYCPGCGKPIRDKRGYVVGAGRTEVTRGSPLFCSEACRDAAKKRRRRAGAPETQLTANARYYLTAVDDGERIAREFLKSKGYRVTPPTK